MSCKSDKKVLRFLNYTPHSMTIQQIDNSTIMLIASSGCVRCTCESSKIVSDPEKEYPFQLVTPPQYTGLEGLPEYVPNTVIIVSMVVGEYIRAHPETWPGTVIGPDTGPESVERDEHGQIICVRRMIAYKR